MRERRTIEITPFGSTLVVDSDSEEMLEQIGAGLGRYPSRPDIGGSLRIVVNVDEVVAGAVGMAGDDGRDRWRSI